MAINATKAYKIEEICKIAKKNSRIDNNTLYQKPYLCIEVKNKSINNAYINPPLT
ncbi:hypothetical protein AGMMS49574_05220 [Bacteroidia bacterium]|nr:hypothetical protein AGMMS49574_05220 [Bacteroidia bacterium]